MNIQRLLIKSKQLAKRPPPLWKVYLVLGVIAACLLIGGMEYIWGWPEWLKVNKIKM